MIPYNNQRFVASIFFDWKKLSKSYQTPIESMGDLCDLLKNRYQTKNKQIDIESSIVE